MSKNYTRRDFLKGAAVSAVGVASLGMFGASAAAETAEFAGGTKYTTYANPDQIGIVQETDQVEEFDAVYVGTGISGFMGAMIIAEQMPEAKVLLLEKNGYCGGSTNFAECNTPQGGTADLAEARRTQAASMYSKSFMVDGELFAQMRHDRGKNSNWLFFKHNIGWSGMFYEGGNGTIPIQKLQAELESDPAYANVDLRLSTRAAALLMKDEYTCEGVQICNEDGSYTNVYAKAVVLATGGMSTNFGLLKYYTGQDVEQKCHGWGAGQDGDGHLMVEQTAHGMAKRVTVSSLFNNVPGFAYDSPLGVAVCMQPANLYVNQYGRRPCSEYIQGTSASGKFIESQGKVFSILGQNLLQHFENAGCTRKYSAFSDACAGAELDFTEELAQYESLETVFKADTLEELAAAIGVDADTFVETVNQYNADAEAGEGDTAFEKDAQYMVALGEGPYYAFRISSGVLNTNEGIRVDNNAMVVDPYYKPVEGLFASGVCVSGFDGEVYGGGTCQPVGMWCSSKSARVIIERYLGGTVAEDWFGDEEYVAAQGTGGPPQ